MLSYRICMGCKHIVSVPQRDKNGMAIGASISCEFDKLEEKDRCKLCSNWTSAWGSLYESEDE